MKDIDAVRNGLKLKSNGPITFKKEDLLSSGSTLLNIACSGRVDGAFAKGHQYLFVGDSDSGKTFLTLTCIAEAAKNPEFEDYDFIYNGTENGALMNKAKFFGKKMAKRLIELASPDIEHLYYDLDDRVKTGTPFIYIVDSMDALDSKQSAKKFHKQKLAYRSGREEAGEYGDGKAKINSQNLRRIVSKLKKTGSILILIAQSRDTFQMGYGDNRTRAGGRALKFYCALEMWSSVVKHLTTKVQGKDREQGIVSLIKVRKNRINGRNRNVRVRLYHSFGIDDLGSCIDYLILERHWKGSLKKSTKILAPEFDFKGTQEDLIKQIEEEGAERELRAIVRKVWNSIEEKTKVRRKQRYD